MRITQNSITRNYLKNLNSSISNLSKSNEKISSGRSFSKVSENVSDAAKAFKIREQLYKNEQYETNVRDANSQLASAESNLTNINSLLKNAQERIIQGKNGTMSQTARETLATEVASLRDEILQQANAKYADQYLFGGTNNTSAPFTVSNSGKLQFNGIDVDSIYKNSAGKAVYKDTNGVEQLVPQNKDVYIDIGLGVTLTGGDLDTRTALKYSTSGLEALGFGTTTINGEEVPNNIYNLLDKVAKDLREGNATSLDSDLTAVQKRQNGLMLSITEIGSRSSFLEDIADRLDTDNINLKQTQKDLEGIKYEDECINNKTYETSWMVALQLGSKILPSSIFDFMK